MTKTLFFKVKTFIKHINILIIEKNKTDYYFQIN